MKNRSFSGVGAVPFFNLWGHNPSRTSRLKSELIAMRTIVKKSAEKGLPPHGVRKRFLYFIKVRIGGTLGIVVFGLISRG